MNDENEIWFRRDKGCCSYTRYNIRSGSHTERHRVVSRKWVFGEIVCEVCGYYVIQSIWRANSRVDINERKVVWLLWEYKYQWSGPPSSSRRPSSSGLMIMAYFSTWGRWSVCVSLRCGDNSFHEVVLFKKTGIKRHKMVKLYRTSKQRSKKPRIRAVRFIALDRWI